MGNAYLDPGDLGRLSALVERVKTRSGCSTAEAIAQLEDAVETKAAAPAQSVYAYAARIHQLRIARDKKLGTRAFRDPAWEMVLDLLVAQHERRDTCVTDLCIGSGVPATTALRHIERLERQGVLQRRVDQRDNRRSLIELDPEKLPAIVAVVAEFQACV